MVGVVLLAVAFGWSLFVNARGAFSWSTALWNTTPVATNYTTTARRFWDWGDPPFLRFGYHTIRDIYPNDTTPAIPSGTECIAS